MKIQDTYINKKGVRRFVKGEKAYKIICNECGGAGYCRKQSLIRAKQYCSRKCQRAFLLKEKDGHFNWKGGKRVIAGRNYTMVKGHPRASRDGYIPNYVLNIEKSIGRYLIKGEVVHHIDLDKTNDISTNLYVCEDWSEHQKIHYQMQQLLSELYKKGKITFKNGRYEDIVL